MIFCSMYMYTKPEYLFRIQVPSYEELVTSVNAKCRHATSNLTLQIWYLHWPRFQCGEILEEGRIWASNLRCRGDECNLDECPHLAWLPGDQRNIPFYPFATTTFFAGQGRCFGHFSDIHCSCCDEAPNCCNKHRCAPEFEEGAIVEPL